MRAVCYRQDGKRQTGFLSGEQVYAVTAVMHALNRQPDIKDTRRPETIDEWLIAGEDAWSRLLEAYQTFSQLGAESLQIPSVGEIEELTLEPVLCNPGKIICAALNYPDPRGSYSKPDYPVLFLKPRSTLTGHGQPILLPPGEQRVEYEGEIAVVIGRKGKHISQHEASTHIAGYCLANDIGAKDIQERSSQWASGKMQDTFTPLGPCLVTPDEIADANNLRLQTLLNGETVQDEVSAAMFYSIAELIAYISSLTTLEAGDLILSGSPRSSGSRPDPRIPLKPGDRIEIAASGLGTLSNPVLREEMIR